MKFQIIPTRRRQGFSLVELLTVIAILGVLASLSIMAMAGISDTSRVAAAKNQAQRIASVFSSGLAAGAPGFVAADGVDQCMNAVGTGSNGSSTFSDVNFRLAGISAGMDEGKPAAEQAKTYLYWAAGTLVYDASGAGGSSAGAGNGDDGWQTVPAGEVTSILRAYMQITGNTSANWSDLVQWYNDRYPSQEMRENGGVLQVRNRQDTIN